MYKYVITLYNGKKFEKWANNEHQAKFMLVANSPVSMLDIKNVKREI